MMIEWDQFKRTKIIYTFCSGLHSLGHEGSGESGMIVWATLFIFLSFTWIGHSELQSKGYRARPLARPDEPGSSTQKFRLNRVTVNTNVRRQTSVRLHGYNSGMILMHLVLRFSSAINTYHAPLLIDSESARKYHDILQDDTHRVVLNSRGQRKRFHYHVAIGTDKALRDSNDDGIDDKLYALIQSMRLMGRSTTTAGLSYDGVLLLDDYSALWHEYNVARFEWRRLILEYRHNVANISTNTAPTTIRYDGQLSFACAPDGEEDQCWVATGAGGNRSGLLIDGHAWPHYRLVVNLDSPQNFLPVDLYFLWQQKLARGDTTPMVIALQPQPGDTSGGDNNLYLHSRFQYSMHELPTVVLGIDLIHFFPCVEYSPETRAFQLWYFAAATGDGSNIQNIRVFFVFVNLVLLFCLYKWTGLYNYHVLKFVVYFEYRARKYFYFTYKQISYELTGIILALVVILCSFLVSSQTGSSTVFQYNGTDSQKRTILFAALLAYQTVAMFIIFVSDLASVRAYWHYYVKRDRPLNVPRTAPNQKKKRASATTATTKARPQASETGTLLSQHYVGELTQRKKMPLGAVSQPPNLLVDRQAEKEINESVDAFGDVDDAREMDRLYGAVVSRYHDPVIKKPVALTTMRNAAFVGLILTALLLSYNFYTDQNNFYLLLLMFVSGALIYFKVNYIAKGLFFQLAFREPRVDTLWPLVLGLILDTVALIVFIVFAYGLVFVAYFDTLNSTFSQTALHAFAVTLVCIVIAFAVYMVARLYDEYAETLFDRQERRMERAQQEREKREYRERELNTV